MLAETRRRMLIELINRHGFATLDELVKSLGVSESTVRRDLEVLDQAGSVRRTHGGAVCSAELRGMPAFEDRTTAAADEKRAIGRHAASLIDDGETVLLDGGTTTLEIARALAGRAVQVVTNSLPIAQMLAAHAATDLILIGGYVYPRTGVAMGPLAIAALERIRVRRAILGAGGVMPDGVYNSNSLLVDTERAMMRCGQEVLLVADSTKFGRQSLTRLCGLDAFQRVVTDDQLSADDFESLRRAGAEVDLVAAHPTEGQGEAAARLRRNRTGNPAT